MIAKELTGSTSAAQKMSNDVRRYESCTYGEPVVRLVLLDLRGGAVALLQVRGVRDEVEVAATDDCSERQASAQITLQCGDGKRTRVDMRRLNARLNDLRGCLSQGAAAGSVRINNVRGQRAR